MSTSANAHNLPETFTDFKPVIKVASPGRINLIGEHTDYNNGFVMPTAIDKKIYLEFKENDTESTCRVYSATYNAYLEYDANNLSISENSWENYVLGVTNELKALGKSIKGFDCVIESDLSTGAGISSSAALECGFASGLNALFNLGLSKTEITKLSQKAEHNFVGNKCGIMDQYASVMSKKDHIILLDCESLHAEYIPADFKSCKLLLLNTNVSHNLADSEYNTRRQECETAVEVIQQKYPEVKSLRDVNLEMLSEFEDKLEGKQYQRSRYVIEENERVMNATTAIKSGELSEFGTLMYGSHDGLQHDYEVSCPELDFLVEFSRDKDYIYGSRMMGGGFGGCTINLIEADKIDEYVAEAAEAYYKKFNIKLDTIAVLPSEGTIVEKL
ncbi:galactokinase [Zunongwangia endophytica]|uniref:Galactokinase n=1 Tax=Zunongwangia endophytica TaxID=1808945 RepID=A0ABV8HEB0_9FLAO|nr:galactokinase [Zunongwangia endophytica]MDN3593565.1 galactokinase [Zunongwangia endophytica]